MVAEIISVGTELLLGNIVNTNAQYIAKEMARLGIDLYYQSVVGDNEERLSNVLKTALERSDLIITTGGLGPTKDDLTKEVAASYFGKQLIFDEKTYQHVKKRLESYGISQMTESQKNRPWYRKERWSSLIRRGWLPELSWRRAIRRLSCFPDRQRR